MEKIIEMPDGTKRKKVYDKNGSVISNEVIEAEVEEKVEEVVEEKEEPKKKVVKKTK
jgi:molybdopterin biosynthesis enzyme